MAQPVVVTGRVKRFQKVLTNTEIKALPSGEFTFLAAPAATAWWELVSGYILVDALLGAYTNVSPTGYLSVTYDGGTTCSSYIGNDNTVLEDDLTDFSALFDSANRRRGVIQPWTQTVHENQWGNASAVEDMSLILGKALTLSCSNNLGDFMGGNAANTMRVVVDVRLESL